ncbi:MAG: hydantoinase/oxoprolinase family protein [Acidobacteriota bacterium]|nr:hydantoinase/oxoprolinase family protein [Acidobacteriota bacterium]MEE3273640.1 hydantoinase/oxoprolinase family protein [Acidobacteriota bacterium]
MSVDSYTSRPRPSYRVATDVGGTFTDLVGYRVDKDEQTIALVTLKVESTTPDFERGVLEAIDRVGIDAADMAFFSHGSTVLINALLSRRGAKTGLITTRGFRDVLEIGRGDRPDLFNFNYRKPSPFVPRHLRLEVTERLDQNGHLVTPLALEEIAPLVDTFRAEDVEAIAICFLHSYANPSHETMALEEVRRLWPEVSLLASHQITGEWREYERTSSTVIGAYVHPVTVNYVSALSCGIEERGCSVSPHFMLSNGGIATADSIVRSPLGMIESGPASGVLGAAELSKTLGIPDVVTLDIGGTTAKCSLIENHEARMTTDYYIERSPITSGYPVRTPVVDIVEIGTGGGSIARLDAGGSLHVGPESAAAQPGPAVYGRGGDRPTNTDAHVLTGRIDKNKLLGGEIEADTVALQRAFEPLANALGLDVVETARGILRVANANMVNALTLVSLNRGYDPRAFTLIAYGGGGGLHAVELAEELGFAGVVIPANPSVFSAWGMLVTDLRRDHMRTRVMTLDADSAEAIEKTFVDLIARAVDELTADGVERDRMSLERRIGLRYKGQEHTVEVEFQADGIAAIAERFHQEHERVYTYRLDAAIECVDLHLVARGLMPRPEPVKSPVIGRSVDDALIGTRRVDFGEHGAAEADIYERILLEPSMVIDGPAIIEEPTFTFVLPPGRALRVDDYANLHVSLRENS